MNHRRTFAAVAVLLVVSAGLRAGPPVIVVAPSGGFAFGPRFSPGVVFGAYGPAPRGYYGGYYGGGYRVSSLTIIGSGYGAPPAAPPQVNITININNNPSAADSNSAAALDVRDEDFPDKVVIRPRRAAPVEDKLAVRPDPVPPAPRVKPPEPLPPPPPKMPDPAPKESEFDRLMRLGGEAFAGQRYGLAERRFEQAVAEAPKEPLAQFHLAQACFALGKYQEAVAAIHAGLRLDPNWPSSRFKARDLYGPNNADFAVHFRDLEAARFASPNDPVLLFLSAYQMWFDNRQEDARPLLRRAARLVAEPRFMDLFLLAQPGGAVAAR